MTKFLVLGEKKSEIPLLSKNTEFDIQVNNNGLYPLYIHLVTEDL